MYGTILLATDGSPHTQRAAEYVATLADRFDAEVHVLAVADIGSAAGAFDAGGVEAELIERLRERSQEWADATAADVAGAEVTVVNGRPRKAILEYADEVGADLVAMGTHGRTGIRRFVIGSVTEHVLRRADAPVLTARAEEEADEEGEAGATERPFHPAAIDRVLLPTDGSPESAAAVDHAAAVAEACGASVRVLSVVDTRAMAAQSELAPSDTVVRSLEDQSQHAVGTAAEQLEAAGVDVETDVIQGAPSETICEEAESGADLVVMGTRGRSGLDRVLLGSVTERTVRHAPVPVMTVRAED
jgi:nucleotide-binding universal stress UspA family protein